MERPPCGIPRRRSDSLDSLWVGCYSDFLSGLFERGRGVGLSFRAVLVGGVEKDMGTHSEFMQCRLLQYQVLSLIHLMLMPIPHHHAT